MNAVSPLSRLLQPKHSQRGFVKSMSDYTRNRKPVKVGDVSASQPQARRHAPRRPGPAAVPKWNQIAINGAVSVILKQDQATGRQVQGFVAELLTRGDHPHGVKVRLTDGRVGRVQKLASENEAHAGTSSQPLGRNGEESSLQSSVGTNAKVVYHDARKDGHDYDYDSTCGDVSHQSLEDYVVTKAPRRRKAKLATPTKVEELGTIGGSHGQSLSPPDTSNGAIFASAQSVCPVCNAFEGDEEAVAHHVDQHFS